MVGLLAVSLLALVIPRADPFGAREGAVEILTDDAAPLQTTLQASVASIVAIAPPPFGVGNLLLFRISAWLYAQTYRGVYVHVPFEDDEFCETCGKHGACIRLYLASPTTVLGEGHTSWGAMTKGQQERWAELDCNRFTASLRTWRTKAARKSGNIAGSLESVPWYAARVAVANATRWERVFNLGSNEVAITDPAARLLHHYVKKAERMKPDDPLFQAKGNLIQSKHWGTGELGPGLLELVPRFVEVLKRKAAGRLQRPAYFKPEWINIAVHVRKGDLAQVESNGRHRSTSWSASLLTSVLGILAAHVPASLTRNVHVFGQGEESGYADFRRLGATLHLDSLVSRSDPVEAMAGMATADILIKSGSSFSDIACIYSDGVCVGEWDGQGVAPPHNMYKNVSSTAFRDALLDLRGMRAKSSKHGFKGITVWSPIV